MRTFSLQTIERGLIDVIVLHDRDLPGLVNSKIAEKVPDIPRSVLSAALRGYTRPFTTLLKAAPRYLLVECPRECEHQRVCTFYDPKTCWCSSKNLPGCFQPQDEPQESTELVRWWREGKYVIREVDG